MDWDNSYFTFSDTNIEYIWRFLAEVNRRGWLYKGHRSTQWCPRCGTSLSKHEQAGEENYVELEHPSLFVRFPLKDREGQSLVVWTTTPWTLPANVAAAVHPEAEYGRRPNGEWVAVALHPEDEFVEQARGSELVGLQYARPFRCPAGPGGSRPPRDPVGGRRARRGHRHRPHRAGRRRRGLRALAGARPAGAGADRRVRPDDLPATGSSRAARPTPSRSRSSSRCTSAACSSTPARSGTAIRSAGAARRRWSSASSTTGSSRPTRSGS